MHIVGGIYHEKTVFPSVDVIYGSGGRAAAALQQLNTQIRLTSFVGHNKRADIQYLADHVLKIPLHIYTLSEVL